MSPFWATASTTPSLCITRTSASPSTQERRRKDAADVVLLDKDLGVLAEA